MDKEQRTIMLTIFKSIPTVELFLYEQWIDTKLFYMFMSECLECYFSGGDWSIVMRDCSKKQEELMIAVLQSYIALYNCLFWGWERLKNEMPNLVYQNPGAAFKAILQNVADRTVTRGKQPRKANALFNVLSSRRTPKSEKYHNALNSYIKDVPFQAFNAIEKFEIQALEILSHEPKVKEYYQMFKRKQDEMMDCLKSLTHPRNRHLYLN